ncbi:hypothetical protein [uncultured Jannaschia sp.]|uniref:hypothetical protein n=1 Tax=uncultured Jannaschia sp. TaxID=293347 RepID=UPI002613C513|nr:hypothetical protein [uncultured Jannaschia sp.]
MPDAIRAFLTAERGSVTIDWVILSAALVGLGLAVTGVISKGLDENFKARMEARPSQERVVATETGPATGPRPLTP